MLVIISDIFVRIGLISLLLVVTIGLNIQMTLNFLSKNGILPIFIIVQIVLTVVGAVSCMGGGRLRNVNYLFWLVVVAIFWSCMLVNLCSKFESIKTDLNSFTSNEGDIWIIQPGTSLGLDKNRYILCRLWGAKLCFALDVPNVLFYQSYSMCNIKGELINKDIGKLKTYDFLKKTFLIGRDIRLECRPTLISKIFGIRDFVILKISRNIPRPQASLLSGIIFGVKMSFEESFDRAVKAAGISHIVAASGYNVNILISAISPLLIKLNERWKLIVLIIAIWFYALLTGFSSSMVRACAMSTVLMLSIILKYKISSKKIFTLTVVTLTAFTPTIAYDIGFLLSVAATYGVIFLSPTLEKLIKIKGFPHTTFACTLTTLPITIYFFNTLSPYTIFANMLILPVIEIVMIFGIFGLIFTPILYLAWGSLKYVEIVARGFERLPFSIIELPNNISIVISLILIFLIIIFQLRYERVSDFDNH